MVSPLAVCRYRRLEASLHCVSYLKPAGYASRRCRPDPTKTMAALKRLYSTACCQAGGVMFSSLDPPITAHGQESIDEPSCTVGRAESLRRLKGIRICKRHFCIF